MNRFNNSNFKAKKISAGNSFSLVIDLEDNLWHKALFNLGPVEVIKMVEQALDIHFIKLVLVNYLILIQVKFFNERNISGKRS